MQSKPDRLRVVISIFGIRNLAFSIGIAVGFGVCLSATPALALAPGSEVDGDPLHGLPLTFEKNQGQYPDAFDFLARAPAHNVWLKPGEVIFEVGSSRETAAGLTRRSVVRMRLIGTRASVSAVGLDRQPGLVNIFRGSDPSAWHTQIPTYARVRYSQVLPGIDWEFYGTPDAFEHDFVIAPGADPRAIELAFDGIERVVVDEEGGLRLHTPAGILRLRPPVVYQEVQGARVRVAGRYALGSDAIVRFELGSYDLSARLVIDPVIEYSTYYGGSATEVGYDIAVGRDGNAYVAGTTTSSNLPTSPGAYDELGRVGGFGDPGDAFVMKLAPDGSSLVWATYLSGRGLDRLFGIALDKDENVYVIGDTDSTDDLGTGGVDESYPLVGAAQGSFGGVSDLVVSKLDASGASLSYSTYLGGDDADRGSTDQDRPAIDVDSLGRAHVSVVTQSTNFHTVVGCNLSSPGPYVVRLNASGSSFDTCVGLGGDDFVFARDIVVDTSGRALIVGFTADPNLVTTGGTFSTSPLGGEDAFLVRINAAGTAVETGTYFGGTSDDFANSVALDPSGNVYLTGSSAGGSYPITIGGAPSGSAVVTKLDSALSSVLYSLALGYSDGLGIDVDSLARATVVGTDNFDAGFTLLEANGSISHETFWGGGLLDRANGVALDRYGHAYVTGETRSTGFPGDTVLNTNPFQGTRSGNIDAWIVKHRRDDPVFVPAMTWGVVPMVGAIVLLGWGLLGASRRAGG